MMDPISNSSSVCNATLSTSIAPLIPHHDIKSHRPHCFHLRGCLHAGRQNLPSLDGGLDVDTRQDNQVLRYPDDEETAFLVANGACDKRASGDGVMLVDVAAIAAGVLETCLVWASPPRLAHAPRRPLLQG
jgi:hypothetical protein